MKNNLFCLHSGKIYPNPSSGWIKMGKRRKYLIKAKTSGNIVCERIQKSIDWIKVYFYNAIEAKTGFTFSIEQEHEGFLKAFRGVYPLEIKSWQRDN